MSEEKKEKIILEPNQEYFCQLYASEEEFFGNGTQAYIKAYNIDITNKGSYAAARSSASRLLTKDNILMRINQILEMGVLNDQFVDKELQFLIKQRAELPTKLGAIKEYNAMKARINNKLDLNIKALSNIKFFYKEIDDGDTGENPGERDRDKQEAGPSTPSAQ